MNVKKLERLKALAEHLSLPDAVLTEGEKKEITAGVADLIDRLTVRAALRKPCCGNFAEAKHQGSVHREGHDWFVSLVGGASIKVCPWCKAPRCEPE